MRSHISTVALLLALAPAFSVAWAPDGWTRIGPGGGGAQYIPTISPHDPNTVLVRCDMTGAYLSRNGGDTWGMFNLGGAARFFVFDPLDARTMYTESLGLWRSTRQRPDVEPVVSIAGRYCRCRDAVGSRRRADPDESRALSACRRAGHRSCRLQVPLRGSVRGQCDDTLDLGRRRQELEGERGSAFGSSAAVHRSGVAGRRPDDHRGDRQVPDGSLGRRMERAPGTGAVHRYFRGIPDARRTPAALRCVARQPAHLRRWWRHVAQFGDTARGKAAALRDRHQRATYGSGVRSFRQSGRPAFRCRQDHRCRLALDDGVEGNVRRARCQSARWLDQRATRLKLGRHAAESRSCAHRSEYRLRHRSRADHAFHRRRQELERRVFQEGIGRRRSPLREWT